MDFKFGYSVTFFVFSLDLRVVCSLSLAICGLKFVSFLCIVVVMAGSAPEGTQFDTRQFDQRLNEV